MNEDKDKVVKPEEGLETSIDAPAEDAAETPSSSEQKPEQNPEKNQSAADLSDEDYLDTIRAVVMGQVMSQMPKDLFIPPDALEVVLESFEGPLDLLLYLIRSSRYHKTIHGLCRVNARSAPRPCGGVFGDGCYVG